MQQRLQDLVDHPLVGEVRGVGMMAAVELRGKKGTAAMVREEAWKRGLLVRATGESLILSPPLIITADEVDMLADTLLATLDAVESQPAA